VRVPLVLVFLLAPVLFCLLGCSGSDHSGRIYGAHHARVGESQAVLGWNVSVSNLRWSDDYVLFDIDASPTDPHQPHAKAEDLRVGLYGALSHPMESTGLGSCDDAMTKVSDIASPLKAPPDRLTGTACLGPTKDRSAVRGVYLYSPHDRIAGNVTLAYALATIGGGKGPAAHVATVYATRLTGGVR